MKQILFVGFIAAVLVLCGCTQPQGGGTGQLNLLVSDAQAAIEDFQYLNVDFNGARIFKTDSNTGFEEFAFEKTIDLTTVVGEKAISILEIELPAGTYTKIELSVAGVEAKLLDGTLAEVKVPSEKLKVIKPFVIDANAETKFVFDIEVVKTGQGYNLLPVIGKSGVVGKDLGEDEVEEVEENEEEIPCTVEGETMPVYPGYECCEGLVAINPTTPEQNCEPLLGASICSNCGNEICEQWENYCNCGADCPSSAQQPYDRSCNSAPDCKFDCVGGCVNKNVTVDTGGAVANCALVVGGGMCDCTQNTCVECLGEGGTIPVVEDPLACCTGLELIPPKEENWAGIQGYCTAKCGNGTCDEETESSYNCPEDCQQQ